MSLYKRPGSPFYWSKLYQAGSVVRFSTGERTKVAALRKEREKADELRRAKNLEGRYSLATLAAKFAIWKEADGRSSETMRGIDNHLTLHLFPFFGEERDVRTIDVSDLEDYKAHRLGKVAPQTVGKELSTMRQMLLYAVDVHKLMPAAPHVRNPKFKYTSKGRMLHDAELQALLLALGGRKKRGWEALPRFLLQANTGMRPMEISNLSWDMIDLESRTAALPSWATKTRTPRVVPLNDQAIFALGLMKTDHEIGRVFTAKHQYGSWRKSVKQAGIVGKVRPHDLRHTFGSLLHIAGNSQPEVRDILGHATLFMANIYAHTHEKHLRRAVMSVQIEAPRAHATGTPKMSAVK